MSSRWMKLVLSSFPMVGRIRFAYSSLPLLMVGLTNRLNWSSRCLFICVGCGIVVIVCLWPPEGTVYDE